MGSEIFDSGERPEADSGVRERSAGPGMKSAESAESAVPVFDLGELDDLGVVSDPAAGASGLVGRVRSSLARLRSDANYRRLAVWLVVGAVALVAVSASIVEAHHRHAVTSAAASTLAIDVRVDAQPQLEDPQPGVQTVRGDSSIDVKLHNLGPKPVQFTALLYQLGQPATRSGTLVTTNVSVRPGQQMDRGFHVRLPCGPTPQTAVPPHPAQLTARVRTTDGRTHTVPVDLTALGPEGDLFDSCAVYQNGSGYNIDSELVGGAVQVSMDLPLSGQAGEDSVVVSLSRSGVPAEVGFVTSPRLPAPRPANTHFTVTIRPVVHSCPHAFDLTALPSIGLSFGSDDTYGDPYLPLLVAEAVGRACAGPKN